MLTRDLLHKALGPHVKDSPHRKAMEPCIRFSLKKKKKQADKSRAMTMTVGSSRDFLPRFSNTIHLATGRLLYYLKPMCATSLQHLLSLTTILY